jgi:hypothetical protein
MPELSKNAPEIALFFRIVGITTPLKICYESESVNLANGKIEVELRNRAFIIRSRIDNFIKPIWPDQRIIVKFGNYDYELCVKKCRYFSK